MVDIAGNATTTAVFEGSMAAMATFSGEWETFDDKDWIKVTVTVAGKYKFFGSASTSGIYGGDSLMTLFDANGVQVAVNDDEQVGVTLNSVFAPSLTIGTYFIQMEQGGGDPGSYSVAIVPVQSHQRLTTNADAFSGAASNLLIVGDKGRDIINLDGAPLNGLGEQGDDYIQGDDGNNNISGGLGNDTISGNGLGDYLFGDAGDDYIDGGSGHDRIYGGDGVDVLFGRADQDFLYGGSGADYLQGDADVDRLDGGPGADRMRGGQGGDTYYVDNAADQLIEISLEGSDTVYASVGFVLAAGQEIEVLRSSTPSNVPINFTGNEFGNTLIGNDAVNVLVGKGGADTLIGGLGNDIYGLENGTDVVQDTGGAADIITSTVSRSLSNYSGIERLILIGGSPANAIGNALANVLVGNGTANAIYGLGGNDILTGGAGNDVFVFNTAPSTALNRDVVADFNHVADTFYLENAIFTRLPAGALNPTCFRLGAAAVDANDFIVYNQANGALSYDSNGNGAGGAVVFAILTNRPVLLANDFFVI